MDAQEKLLHTINAKLDYIISTTGGPMRTRNALGQETVKMITGHQRFAKWCEEEAKRVEDRKAEKFKGGKPIPGEETEPPASPAT